MDKHNHLDRVPIATLSDEQLQRLQQTEEKLNELGDDVYLIAFERGAPS